MIDMIGMKGIMAETKAEDKRGKAINRIETVDMETDKETLQVKFYLK